MDMTADLRECCVPSYPQCEYAYSKVHMILWYILKKDVFTCESSVLCLFVLLLFTFCPQRRGGLFSCDSSLMKLEMMPNVKVQQRYYDESDEWDSLRRLQQNIPKH